MIESVFEDLAEAERKLARWVEDKPNHHMSPSESKRYHDELERRRERVRAQRSRIGDAGLADAYDDWHTARQAAREAAREEKQQRRLRIGAQVLDAAPSGHVGLVLEGWHKSVILLALDDDSDALRRLDTQNGTQLDYWRRLYVLPAADIEEIAEALETHMDARRKRFTAARDALKLVRRQGRQGVDLEEEVA